jgi:hypothetical protein
MVDSRVPLPPCKATLSVQDFGERPAFHDETPLLPSHDLRDAIT